MSYQQSTPKHFFLHLLSMVALYGVAVSFSTVVFQCINLWIPDPLEAAQPYLHANALSLLRSSVSFLIVFFPVYIASTWIIHRQYARNPSLANIRVRSWLIYLTLFAAAIVMMIDAVRLINTFLDGELTLRFLLKAITILFVAGSIFGYYVHDLRAHKI